MKSTISSVYLIAIYIACIVCLAIASIFSLQQTYEFLSTVLKVQWYICLALSVVIQFLPTPFFVYAGMSQGEKRTAVLLIAWVLTATDIGTNIGWLTQTSPFNFDTLLESTVTWVLVGGVFCIGIAWAEEAISVIAALIADEMIELYKMRGEQPPAWLATTSKVGHSAMTGQRIPVGRQQ